MGEDSEEDKEDDREELEDDDIGLLAAQREDLASVRHQCCLSQACAVGADRMCRQELLQPCFHHNRRRQACRGYLEGISLLLGGSCPAGHSLSTTLDA